MDINLTIRAGLRIRAFYLFFLIYTTQTGVGIMGGTKYIYQYARHDAWISVLLGYLGMLLAVWAMLSILKSYDNADIFGIQVDIFGKWLGKILGTIYILYFTASTVITLVTYIDVIQLFIFRQINTWILGFLLLSLMVYCVAGGLRSIAGACFIFFIFSQLILLLIYKPVSLIEFEHYQPVLQASTTELLKGAKEMTVDFTGFEILFLLYPFVQNKQYVKRSVLLGVSWSAFVFFLSTVIVIGYFSPHQSATLEWAFFTIFKIVKMPFIARLDFIVVAAWMMMILPHLMVLMWGVMHGMKRIYHVPKKVTLYGLSILIFASCGFISPHHFILKLTSIFGQIGFWLIIVYPLLLLPLVKVKKRLKH